MDEEEQHDSPEHQVRHEIVRESLHAIRILAMRTGLGAGCYITTLLEEVIDMVNASSDPHDTADLILETLIRAFNRHEKERADTEDEADRIIERAIESVRK